MIVNYCIQGLNDLFEVPVDRYPDPRTYTAVTMRDEAGTWSSRPGSGEDADPDGYALTLEGHRHFGVPSMWAFNAAVLTMIAQDCPDRARGDLRGRDPAHRRAGERGVRGAPGALLRGASRTTRRSDADTTPSPRSCRTRPAEGLAVYYPDQRLYGGTRRSTRCTPRTATWCATSCSTGRRCAARTGGGRQDERSSRTVPRLPRQPGAARPRSDARSCRSRTWCASDGRRQRRRGRAREGGAAGLRKLLLQGLHRNAAEWRAGAAGLRRRRGQGLGQRLVRRRLLGPARAFQRQVPGDAVLAARPPWVRVVTVADQDVAAAEPGAAARAAGQRDLPVGRPAGRTAADLYGNLLHFDTWEQSVGGHPLAVARPATRRAVRRRRSRRSWSWPPRGGRLRCRPATRSSSTSPG